MMQQPIANLALLEKMTEIFNVHIWTIEPNANASCSAEPSLFARGHHCKTAYVASTTKHDITSAKSVLAKSSNVVTVYTRYPLARNPPLDHILRHNDWGTALRIVRRMKLTAKRASLDPSIELIANFTDGRTIRRSTFAKFQSCADAHSKASSSIKPLAISFSSDLSSSIISLGGRCSDVSWTTSL